jgi:mono/diheme cytochrome c family protein
MQRVTLNTTLFTIGITIALVAGVPRVAGAQDEAKKGAEVYAAQKCSVCHSIAGKGGKSSALDGIGAKLSADDIRQWIVDPVAMTKKSNSTKKPPMPKKYDKLPAADLDALVAYMVSLK